MRKKKVGAKESVNFGTGYKKMRGRNIWERTKGGGKERRRESKRGKHMKMRV